MQQVLNSRHRKNIDFNHVVASMPDFLVDSDDPLDRALLVLKTLLKHHWGIEDFTAIYHPYRINKEYRKDQYEHHGESGEGDMTWKDVLSTDNPSGWCRRRGVRQRWNPRLTILWTGLFAPGNRLRYRSARADLATARGPRCRRWA